MTQRRQAKFLCRRCCSCWCRRSRCHWPLMILPSCGAVVWSTSCSIISSTMHDWRQLFGRGSSHRHRNPRAPERLRGSTAGWRPGTSADVPADHWASTDELTVRSQEYRSNRCPQQRDALGLDNGASDWFETRNVAATGLLRSVGGWRTCLQRKEISASGEHAQSLQIHNGKHLTSKASGASSSVRAPSQAIIKFYYTRVWLISDRFKWR